MTAANQDSTTKDGDAVRHIKDYCTQAVENLKAGRLKEAYLFANEALVLDEKNVKAAAINRHALYTLHPKKRLLDKARTLHEEAEWCIDKKDYGKAYVTLSLAKNWCCTPGILWSISRLNMEIGRFDLTYLDVTEALQMCKKDKLSFATRQIFCLRYLGYKVVPMLEPEYRLDYEIPTRYHASNWPKGLRITRLNVYLQVGFAVATKMDGATLLPLIPLDQLARFLNDHVQGAVAMLVINSVGRPEDETLRLLDEVTASGRLHTDSLTFFDFFHLPWAGIERIFDGRTLRVGAITFIRLQLPSGVDANKLLQLPAVRECTFLNFQLYHESLPQLPGRPPLFNNVALVEWVKRSDGRTLRFTSDYLSSGLLSFLDTLKKDFHQATQMRSYEVIVHCPHVDVAGLGMQQKEVLVNRLGEMMRVSVDEHPGATEVMGHRFETVTVERLPLSELFPPDTKLFVFDD